jgi:hypothetical protein
VTPADAAELLTLAAAFDRRTVGEADARAWAAALHDMPLDPDARAAIARHYGQSTDWLTPAHVRHHRRKIRDERLGDSTPAYDPPAHDETGAQFIARRRKQLRAIGDGREQPTPIGALKGGPAPEVAARLKTMLGRVGEMPPEIREQMTEDTGGLYGSQRAQFPELAIDCPRANCRAHRGRPCTTSRGREMRGHTHDQRRDAWTALATQHDDTA